MPEMVSRPMKSAWLSDRQLYEIGKIGVTQISLLPSSIPGFYTLNVLFGGEHAPEGVTEANFLVSPSTVIIELGDPIKTSGLVVAHQDVPNDITKKA